MKDSILIVVGVVIELLLMLAEDLSQREVAVEVWIDEVGALAGEDSYSRTWLF